MERCWLCRKQIICQFECYGRMYCSDCFKDHCVGCSEVHSTYDIVDNKMKVFASRKTNGPLIIDEITDVVSIRSDGSRAEVGDIILKINEASINSYNPEVLLTL